MAISLPIVSEWNPSGINKAVADFKKLETNGQRAAFAIKKAALPAAAALAGLAVVGVDAVKAFAEDDAAAQKLAKTLRNVTGATDSQVKSVEEFITKTSIAAAVADDELRPALDALARGTGKVAKAQDLLGLALDISAGTGKDLQTVSDALSKAYNGNFKALKALDPALAKLIDDGASADEVFGALAKTFEGQASTAANTAQGKMKGLSIRFGELKEKIGEAVLPLVDRLLPAFEKFASWATDNTGLLVGIGAAIAGIAVAIVTTNAAMTAWNAIAAVTTVANAVLGTSFTALWVATGVGVIIAVVAALVILEQKFGVLTTVVRFLGDVFSDVWAHVLNSFKTMVNTIASLWNNTIGKLSFKVPSWIPGIGGKGFDVPDIPTFNMSDGPTFAAPHGGFAGGNINVTVTSADPNQVVSAIQRWVRDNGAVPMTTTAAIRR